MFDGWVRTSSRVSSRVRTVEYASSFGLGKGCLRELLGVYGLASGLLIVMYRFSMSS